MAELNAPKRIRDRHRAIRGWLKINWAELWEYRDLLVLLVQRDFISRYKQTILGPLWHLLQPLLTAAVFAAIFNARRRHSHRRHPDPALLSLRPPTVELLLAKHHHGRRDLHQ